MPLSVYGRCSHSRRSQMRRIVSPWPATVNGVSPEKMHAPVGAGLRAMPPTQPKPTGRKKPRTSRGFFIQPERLARECRRVDPSHVFHHANDLAAVAELVVVPHVQHNTVVLGNGRFRVHHTGVARANEVGGDLFLGVDEVDLLMQIGVQRHVAQVLVHLVASSGFLKVQVENGHRHVRRRHADRVTGQLAGQLRQGLGGSGGGTGLGDHYVQRGAATTAIALVEVVDQVLVVGVRVNGFDVAVDDAELVIDCLQHRHDGVGGAGSGGHDLVVSGDFRVVDAVNDVLQLAFARRGQDNAGNARAGQVLAQAFGVAPYAGVIHQQGVLDAVLGVIHLGRVLRVDHLDQVTVGGDGVVFFVDDDGAVERTVYRVATQEARALGQVVLGALAYHDGAQA